MEWDAYANRKLQFPKCKSYVALWIKSRFSKVVFYVSVSAVLALLVLTFNIHRKTGAPLQSALGCVTSGEFRSATGTLTVTPRKGCPGTLSQTCRHLLWGLLTHSSHPDLTGKRKMHICLRAAKLLQLFFQAFGNGPDQWKSISSCNPIRETLEIPCETLCENVTPATKDANLNLHLQISTVQFLWHEMDLHTPSLLSFGTKNLLAQSKRTCPDLLNEV